jgi:phage terminase small subunit
MWNSPVPYKKGQILNWNTTGNATQAARKAGYSSHCPAEIDWENLKKPEIQEAVQAGLDAMAARCEVDADKIVRELASIALANVSHYEFDEEGQVQLTEGAPAEAILAVASVKHRKRTLTDGSTTVESELKLHDKLEAIQLLGRKLRLWTDRVEVENNAQDTLYRELLRQLREGNGSN